MSYSTKAQEFAERLRGDMQSWEKRDFSLRKPTRFIPQKARDGAEGQEQT